MEEDRRELRDYYVESSPARRRQILNVAMETQSDPEADEIRLQIWKLRYAKARENGKSGRADGYLKLWMDLRYLAENPPGRFSVKKTQKRLERELEELGFFQFYDQSEQSRMLLFQRMSAHGTSVREALFFRQKLHFDDSGNDADERGQSTG